MNTYYHINNQDELEQLIERYFEGETSLQEEQLLRQSLASCQWSSDIIDEARFTLGYFSAHKQQHRQRPAINRSRYIAIAASIALLLTLGIGVLWQSQHYKNECIAYVNGKAIHNEREVLNLMQSDLNEMGNATQSIEEQLSSLGEAIEIDI